MRTFTVNFARHVSTGESAAGEKRSIGGGQGERRDLAIAVIASRLAKRRNQDRNENSLPNRSCRYGQCDDHGDDRSSVVQPLGASDKATLAFRKYYYETLRASRARA